MEIDNDEFDPSRNVVDMMIVILFFIAFLLLSIVCCCVCHRCCGEEVTSTMVDFDDDDEERGTEMQNMGQRGGTRVTLRVHQEVDEEVSSCASS